MKISDYEIRMRKPDDFHNHSRTGSLMHLVIPYTVPQFGRILAMPNTLPNPIIIGPSAAEYKKDIEEFVRLSGVPGGEHFEVLPTIKLLESTTPEMILEARKYGVIAGKAYPRGVTTNSDDGIADFKKLDALFEAMQQTEMVLCLHGQLPDAFILQREREFLPILERICRDFPKLRIVFEHVSTSDAVSMVAMLPDTVAATITLHHMLLTLDDVIGGKLNPHNFCQPVVQSPEDRRAVLVAAFSGNPKFFFGSDSAPHLKSSKESGCCAAGVFSMVELVPSLVELFQSHGRLKALEPFSSEFGSDFYRLTRNEEAIHLISKELAFGKRWAIPESIISEDGKLEVVPFRAGKEMQWTVV